MVGWVLRDWEQELAPRLTTVGLIGELELSEEQTDELAKLIERLIRRSGAGDAIEILEESYPCTFLAYLVFVGVHSYQNREYWPAVREGVKLKSSPAYQLKWGQAFKRILLQKGLDYDFGPGRVYVGPILAHGGIPKDLLPRFFQDLLHPSVLDARQTGLTARELIATWNRFSTTLPKPIERFLEYGEQIAERFVEHCREMAREMLSGEFPTAAELGLPGYVVEKYLDWLTAPGVQHSQALPPRRPRLRFDPWGEGVVLHLPEQRLALDKTSQVRWLVGPSDHRQEIPVRVRRVEGVWQSESREIPIPAPLAHWVAELQVDGRSCGNWKLPISPPADAPSLLAFHAATGASIALSRLLPAHPLHLLVPPGVELTPREALHSDLPLLYREWYPWSAYTLDPTDLSKLDIHRPNGSIFSLAVAPIAEIRLEGGLFLLGADSGTPLYSGNLPRLRLPLASQSQPQRWQLDLRGAKGSQPASDRLSLAQLYHSLEVQSDAVYLPLSKVLTSRAMGDYRLTVSGPLGQNAEFRLTVVPSLTLAGHETLYLPDPERGAAPVPLIVSVGATSTVEAAAGSDALFPKQIASEAERLTYQVEVPPERSEAILRVLRGAAGVGQAGVTLTIPVRRLRWALLLDNPVPSWGDQPIRLTRKEVEQPERITLLVDLPTLRPLPTPHLHLLAEGKPLRELESVSSHPGRFWQFDLRELRADVRHSDTPLVEFCIALPDKGGMEQRISLLEVRQGLELKRFVVNPLIQAQLTLLRLEWAPDMRLRERQVRLWPTHRPWIMQPQLLNLPDTARGHCEIVSAATLPAGHYLAELVVDNPWAPAPVQRPDTQAAQVAALVVGTVADRLAALEGRRGEPLAWAEQALIHQEQGEEQATRRALYRFYKEGDEVPLDAIVALTGALRAPHTDEIRLQAFLLQRLEVILETRRRGGLPEDWFKWFVRAICRPYLQSKASRNEPALLLRLLEAGIHAKAAIKRLVDIERPEGIRAALKQWEEKHWGDGELLEVFERRPQFAFQELLTLPQSSNSELLCQQLLKRNPKLGEGLVKTGYWVRCQAGWGRITGIRTSTGKLLRFALRDYLTQGYHLEVTLRPDSQRPEPVVIAIGPSSVVRFRRRAECIYRCSKCDHYATQYQACLTEEHNNVLHRGIKPAFTVIRAASLPQRVVLEFSPSPPHDPFL